MMISGGTWVIVAAESGPRHAPADSRPCRTIARVSSGSAGRDRALWEGLPCRSR